MNERPVLRAAGGDARDVALVGKQVLAGNYLLRSSTSIRWWWPFLAVGGGCTPNGFRCGGRRACPGA